MKTDNLNDSVIKDLLKRVRALETASPIGFSSITRGALRVASPEGLLVEGSAKVTGTLDVAGTENVAGTLNVTGTENLTGDLKVNGGKITVAGSVPMTLGVTSNGRPGVEFSGGRMSSNGSRIALESGSSAVGAGGTFASISAGSFAVVAQTDGVYILNLPTTTNAPNLYADPATGKLYRSIGIEA